MEPQEFRTALRWLLGLPVVPESFCCPCGALFDFFGDHAVMCGTGGDVSTRHNQLRDLIFKMLVRTCGKGRVELETKGIIPGSCKRPGDITVKGWSCGRDLVLDVTCRHGLQSQIISQATLAAGAACAAGDQAKHRSYDNQINPQHYDFLPLSCDTFGVWSPGAEEFFNKLAREYAHVTFSPAPEALSQLQQRLSMCIFKNVSRQIIKRAVSPLAQQSI
jgi:hypothetical protein